MQEHKEPNCTLGCEYAWRTEQCPWQLDIFEQRADLRNEVTEIRDGWIGLEPNEKTTRPAEWNAKFSHKIEYSALDESVHTQGACPELASCPSVMPMRVVSRLVNAGEQHAPTATEFQYVGAAFSILDVGFSGSKKCTVPKCETTLLPAT